MDIISDSDSDSLDIIQSVPVGQNRAITSTSQASKFEPAAKTGLDSSILTLPSTINPLINNTSASHPPPPASKMAPVDPVQPATANSIQTLSFDSDSGSSSDSDPEDNFFSWSKTKSTENKAVNTAKNQLVEAAKVIMKAEPINEKKSEHISSPLNLFSVSDSENSDSDLENLVAEASKKSKSRSRVPERERIRVSVTPPPALSKATINPTIEHDLSISKRRKLSTDDNEGVEPSISSALPVPNIIQDPSTMPQVSVDRNRSVSASLTCANTAEQEDIFECEVKVLSEVDCFKDLPPVIFQVFSTTTAGEIRKRFLDYIEARRVDPKFNKQSFYLDPNSVILVYSDSRLYDSKKLYKIGDGNVLTREKYRIQVVAIKEEVFKKIKQLEVELLLNNKKKIVEADVDEEINIGTTKGANNFDHGIEINEVNGDTDDDDIICEEARISGSVTEKVLNKPAEIIEDPGAFVINMKGKDGVEVKVKVRPSSVIKNLAAYYLKQRNLSPSTKIKLQFEGETLNFTSLVQDTELEEDFTIDIYID